jgi:hypothetical protein
LKLFRSESIELATPLYYIFNATFYPFFNSPSCTYPIDAAANGYRFSSLNCFCHSGPYYFSNIAITYLIGIISASDLALSIASFITGGITLSSYIDRI